MATLLSSALYQGVLAPATSKCTHRRSGTSPIAPVSQPRRKLCWHTNLGKRPAPKTSQGRVRASAEGSMGAKAYTEIPPSDGSTRFYYSPMCPYAQRTMIAVKYKEVDLEWVEIDLRNKPDWYKEKYPAGKVPALEHNGQVIGESLDLLAYFDKHFSGPLLAPQEPEKQKKAEEMITFADKNLLSKGYGALTLENASKDAIHALIGPLLDKLEAYLQAFSGEGPFFLGKFSNVDAVIVPFLERVQFAFAEFRDYDLFEGYPHLDKWMKAMEAQPFYMETRVDRQRLYEMYKWGLESGYFKKIAQVSDDVQKTPAPAAR